MTEKVIDAIEKTNRIASLHIAGAHFGCARSHRHPSTAAYIFGVKNRVEIFDLEETEKLLMVAKEFAASLGKEGKRILFVGGKPEAQEAVMRAAVSLGMPYVAGRWIGGTITNWNEIKKRVLHLADLVEKREKGELAKYTKWERLEIDHEIENLEARFSGIRDVRELPHALFVIDTRAEHSAVAEARKAGIPVIALLNSDCNMREVTHPILGNDATRGSITYFINEIITAYTSGAKEGFAQNKIPVAEEIATR